MSPTANTLADQQTHPQCPVYHRIDVPDGATGDIDVTVDLAIRVIGIRIIKTGGAGGAGDTIQLKNGSTAITDAVSINVADQAVIPAPGTIDDAQWDIAAGGDPARDPNQVERSQRRLFRHRRVHLGIGTVSQ